MSLNAQVSNSSPRELRLGGTLLRGRFELRERLGEGGMGIVYAAFDAQRQRAVALKTLSRLDAASIYRLKLEFRALADVSHPNLVGLHELFVHNDLWFFTMDLVRGETMDAWLQTPRSADELRRTFGELAVGVTAIHRAGKVHRDLKPRNAIVTLEGRVVILDFGLAADPASGGIGQTVDDTAGTPAYIAPEQATGDGASPASDWYAFGAMLYEALTGSVPFAASGPKFFANKLGRDGLPPSHERSQIPGDLDHLCERLLRRAPELRPTPTDVLEALGVAARDPSPARRQAPMAFVPLVGRREELAVLRAAYETSRGGEPRAVFIRGESGIGKSALVAQFIEELRNEGDAVILAGRCYERESVPFKAFDSVVDELSRYLCKLSREQAAGLMPREAQALARVFPVLNRVPAVASAPARDVQDPDDLRQRAFSAFGELLARIRDRRPLVVFVDDLQWTDEDSTSFLQFLVGSADPIPLLFVAAFRAEHALNNPLLQRIVAAVGAAEKVTSGELPLGPLSAAFAEELARSRLPAAPQQRHVRIAEESSGSPFFVETLCRFELESTGATDPTLTEAISRGLESLPEAARRLLQVIAVCGRPTSERLCAAAAGLGTDAHGALDLLCNAQLVSVATRDSDRRVECYHDRVREAVISAVDAGRLRDLHGTVARLLEQDDASDADQLSEHWRAANEPRRAAEWAARGAPQALSTLAFDRALRLSTFAQTAGQLDEATRRSLRIISGDALTALGRGIEAAEAYLAAEQGAPPVESLELRRRAAERLLMAGEVDRGTDLIDGVLTQLGMPPPSTRLGSLGSYLWQRALARVRSHDFVERPEASLDPLEIARVDALWSGTIGLAYSDDLRADEIQARCLGQALRLGEPNRVARALLLEYAHFGRLGAEERVRTEPLLARATALVDRSTDPLLPGISLMLRGVVSMCQGDHAVALRLSQEAVASLRGKGQDAPLHQTRARVFQGISLWLLGEFAALSHELPNLIADAERRQDAASLAGCGGVWWRAVYLAADDLAGSAALARRAADVWNVKGFHFQDAYALIADVFDALYAGDAVSQRETLARRWQVYDGSQLWRVPGLHSFALFARGATALSVAHSASSSQKPALLDEARRYQVQAQALESKYPCSSVYAGVIRAGTLRLAGDLRGALQALHDTERHAEAHSFQMFRAAIRCHRGQLIGGDEGAALVAEANATMRAQGVVNPARMIAVLAPS